MVCGWVDEYPQSYAIEHWVGISQVEKVGFGCKSFRRRFPKCLWQFYRTHSTGSYARTVEEIIRREPKFFSLHPGHTRALNLEKRLPNLSHEPTAGQPESIKTPAMPISRSQIMPSADVGAAAQSIQFIFRYPNSPPLVRVDSKNLLVPFRPLLLNQQGGVAALSNSNLTDSLLPLFRPRIVIAKNICQSQWK